MPTPFPRDEAADYQGLIDFAETLPEEERVGLLSRVFSEARDMLSPGGILNPTGPVIEPTAEGLMGASQFGAEMLNPVPGVDRSIEAFQDGRYVDAFAEGATAIPMIAMGSAPPRGARATAGGAAPRDADDYINMIGGKRIDAADRPNLGMGDMYGMAPRGARTVQRMDGGDLGTVRIVQDGDDFYALARNPDINETDVIGYAMSRGDGTELAVVNEAQGRGIGSELSYLYRRNNPMAPSGGFTESGERAARRTYDRLVQEGVLPPPKRLASDLPAPRNAAERQADDIAAMLREGRADDITDDMMANADPQRLWRLYDEGATGQAMPMDTPSRMARARDMGFDTDVYHGTAGDDFVAFQQGPDVPLPTRRAIWLSETPDGGPNYIAQSRMDSAGQEGGRVLPLKANLGNMQTIDAGGMHAVDVRGVQSPWDQGYDSLALNNVREFGQDAPTRSIAVSDPNRARSTFARFDPRLSHLRNLNAGIAPVGLGLGALGAATTDDN